MGFARPRRLDVEASDRKWLGHPRQPFECDREGIGNGRPGIAAFGKRPWAAEHQQSAAASFDELADHPQLIARERARFDAAEHQPAIGEELLARLREPGRELVWIVDLEEALVLVVGGPLQRHDREVLVVVDRAVQKRHLRPRLTFVVQDLLASIGNVDQGLAHVVLGHELTGTGRDSETEHPWTGIRRRESHPHRCRLAVLRQLHLLGADDAAFVLDVKRDGLAGVPGLRHDCVDHERRAKERGPRRRYAVHLHVAREPVPAHTHGEHRHCRCLQPEQRVAQRRVGGVRAVAHKDHPGQRQPRELLARTVESRAKAGLHPAERQLVGRLEAPRRGGEPERPKNESFRQGLDQRRVLAERLLDERTARLGAPVGNLHASRVVDEDGEEVLLRNGCLDHEDRAEQAEQHEGERRQAQDGQDDPVAHAPARRDRPIREHGRNNRRHGDRRGDVRTGGGCETKLPLLKNHRPIAEKEMEQRIQGHSGGWARLRPPR